MFLSSPSERRTAEIMFSLCVSAWVRVRTLTVAIFNRFWWNLAQTSGTWQERSLSLGVNIQ